MIHPRCVPNRVKPRRAGATPGLGFTLVELLVVVSIIALLIAILLPSLKGARAQAKQTLCLNNCHQMAIAMQQYSLDHRDHFPASGGHGNPSEDPEGWWLNILARYVNTPELFRCPEDKAKNFVDWNVIDWEDFSQEEKDELEEQHWGSYALNYLFVKEPDPFCENMGRIRQPASAIVVSEAPTEWKGADHTHPEKFLDNWPELPKRLLAGDRHRGQSNYIFADGHVESLSYKNTLNPRDRCLWDPATAPAWSEAMEDAPPPPPPPGP